MTVQDLIYQLQKQDPTAEVVFAYAYGDHVGSTVVESIEGATRAPVYWSEYHRSMKLTEPKYREDERDEEAKHAVVLHYNVDEELLDEDTELEDTI